MHPTDSADPAGANWRDLIDDWLVVANAHHPIDLGGHRARAVPAVFAPRDVADVRRIVGCASKTGLPLYPVSTGRNWGLGSRLPAVDGCAVLDLAGLDRIRCLDTKRGFAIIEPGVTQRQLAAATAGTPWLVNLTAACADTSIVGNSLERGDGVIRPRASEILGVEAVLADGSLVTTGGLHPDGRYPGRACGPDLTSAFVQSNLGIVTAMVVALVSRPEAVRLMHTRVARARVAEAVETLRLCFVSGIGTATSRVFGCLVTPRDTNRSAAASDSQCEVIMPLLGPTAIVDATADLASRALARVSQPGAVRCLDQDTTAPDDPLFPAVRLVGGEPTCTFVQELFGVDCAELDSGTTGWMVFLPLLPLDSNGPQRALDLLQQAVDQHGVPVRLEIIVASQHSANAVVEIPFATTAEGRAAAHALRETLRATFLSAGMPPSRSNIDHAVRELADRDDGGYRWLSALKSFLDPHNMLAPGHYLG